MEKLLQKNKKTLVFASCFCALVLLFAFAFSAPAAAAETVLSWQNTQPASAATITFEAGYTYAITYSYEAIDPEPEEEPPEEEPPEEEPPEEEPPEEEPPEEEPPEEELPEEEPPEEELPEEELSEEGTPESTQEPSVPPGRVVRNEDGSYELIDENGVPLGRYTLAEDGITWIFEPYIPLGKLPKTGAPTPLLPIALLLLGVFALAAGLKLKKRMLFFPCLLLVCCAWAALSVTPAAAAENVSISLTHNYAGATVQGSLPNISEGDTVNLLEQQNTGYNGTTYTLVGITVTRSQVQAPVQPLRYVIEYYKDSVDAANRIDTVTQPAVDAGTVVTLGSSQLDARQPEGYDAGEQLGGPVAILVDMQVIQVLYLPLPPPPAVITGDAGSIGFNSADIVDSTYSDIPGTIDELGIEYSTSPNLATAATAQGSDGSPFIVQLTLLKSNTTYYYRAYVTTADDTYYGEVKSFTTGAEPNVITGNVINITANSATIFENTYSGMSGTISSVGIQYSTSPTFSGAATASGTIGSPFIVNLTGLQPNTKYYYRAYVTSTNGTFFGDVKEFTTPAVVANVITGEAANITANRATIVDNTYSGMSGTISNVGIQYSTNTNMASASTVLGSIGSPFAVNLTGLQPSTTYYYRAGVVTSGGTYFGQIKSFTTPPRA